MRLSGEERERLNALIRTGKRPPRQVLKARVLLRADAPESGEGWSDSEIAAALDTSVDTITRTRQQLVEEGRARLWPASTRPPRRGSAFSTAPPMPS
ncbi:MAG: helix-turn-helix domain-containing protein [Acetobacteraceae bacterium]